MEKLSIRKYAALVGVSHTAVAKAIKSGHIVKGWEAETKKVVVPLANEEWGNAIKEKNAVTINDETGGPVLSFEPLTEGLTFAEARRRKEIYNAEIVRITALKEQGLYVEKQKVFNELFEYSKLIRVAFQSIPDRVIDSILVAKSRGEAHTLLTNAIYDVLVHLANLPEIKS